MSEPRHIDDFIVDPRSDMYAARWFWYFRRPAVVKAKEPYDRKLFCTFEGKRYRVTGASRLGDVWLSEDFNRDAGYDKRVAVDACEAWGRVP